MNKAVIQFRDRLPTTELKINFDNLVVKLYEEHDKELGEKPINLYKAYKDATGMNLDSYKNVYRDLQFHKNELREYIDSEAAKAKVNDEREGNRGDIIYRGNWQILAIKRFMVMLFIKSEGL